MSFSTVPATNTGDKYRASQHNTYVKGNLAELWKYTTVGDITYATGATQLARLGISANKHVAASAGQEPYYKSGLGAINMQLKIVADDTNVTQGASAIFFAPSTIDGMVLSNVKAYVTTAGTTGYTVVSVRNLTKYPSNDALSVPALIASSYNYNASAVTVDANYDDVSTNDKIYVFVGLASVTAPKGLQVFLSFS